MANPFVHIELHTTNLNKAKEFYGKLFGWKLEDAPMPGGAGTYTMISVGEGTGGGMTSQISPGGAPHWLAYVGVDDIVASTKKARELGATVVMEVTSVGDMGTMSIIKDPTGATLALWKAQPMQR